MAPTRDKQGAVVDRRAKAAASLNGDMVMRRSPSAEAEAPAPVRPDDETDASREKRLTGPVQTALAGLRAWGSRLVPKPVAAGAIFVCAYFFFLATIFAGLIFIPDLLFRQ